MRINFGNYSNATLFCSSSGKSLSLGTIDDVKLTQIEEDADYPICTNFGKEMSFECSIENTPEMDELFAKLFPPRSDKLMAKIKWPYLVPVKRHKKWRVQKKWNKRYGMKTVYKDKDIEFKQSNISDNLDGTFTFDFTGCFA